MAQVYDEQHDDQRCELEHEIRSEFLVHSQQEVEDKENARLHQYRNELEEIYETTMLPELQAVKLDIGDQEMLNHQARDTIGSNTNRAMNLRERQDTINNDVKSSKTEIDMLQDELQHMARENEESHKNMHQFVQKILTIDDAAKEFGRTKQGHDDSMRHMRSDHDHLSSQLVQKQRELSETEKKSRIAAVERQLNDRCKGRKRSELGMLHVLMNSHTSGEYENQIAREDGAYVSYAEDMLSEKKNPSGNAFKLHLDNNSRLGQIAEIDAEIDKINKRPLPANMRGRSAKGEIPMPFDAKQQMYHPSMMRQPMMPLPYPGAQQAKFHPTMSTMSLPSSERSFPQPGSVPLSTRAPMLA